MGQELAGGQIAFSASRLGKSSHLNLIMEVDSPTTPFVLGADRRRRVPEPLPVRLVTVADARLPAPRDMEPQLDAFYAGLWSFEREVGWPVPVYRAENFNIRFDVSDPPIRREDMRPLGIEVPSLADAEHKLIDHEIRYARQKGVNPGEGSLLLLDPAGNWIEITESRGVI